MKLTPPLEREIVSVMRSIPFSPPDEIAKPACTAFSTRHWSVKFLNKTLVVTV